MGDVNATVHLNILLKQISGYCKAMNTKIGGFRVYFFYSYPRMQSVEHVLNDRIGKKYAQVYHAAIKSAVFMIFVLTT